MKTKPDKTNKKATIIRKEWPRIRDLTPTGKKLFVVDARPHGRREGFATEQDAITRAEQLALEIENKGTEAVSFPTALRIMAGIDIILNGAIPPAAEKRWSETCRQ